MIPESKFPEIAKGLLEKTRQQRADWREHGRQENTFVLPLQNSHIQIQRISPPTEPDCINLTFFNEERKAVGRWIVQEGDEAWELVSELYGLIVKKITGWDKVLEEIEAFLNSK
jgi:hypothetical protein